ncbi:MAG TPA: hypothetical protein DCS07_17350 [Bdellovibrionales bacterium]|nr:MAG: hypothetical protein A2Z97_05480 [Bdellovibrionales bacterium GWB1_52_6]OFZ05720.1 MAG: hypothetical protein A2X97_03385 [Bdellovibrionales bacterium GWA1_52_35]OFZ37936.1 MAG: hypothetical protein A2070_12920 [Bdellovibrionales bacterium GWC1_52_8]HAR44367.1 hypothetical protein [Bdellovibrionales bacterium]HCM40341.1 hypothetical protein [Bdellovibrionales bacterium]
MSPIKNAYSPQALAACRERITEHLSLATPLIDGSFLQTCPVYLKAETILPTGSFKVRAALNGILSQLERCQSKGVLTSSSGNFAQAVAWAAARLQCSATIVMTSTTSPYKIQRTRDLGAEVIICEPTFEARWATTYRLEKETGKILLHPYDSIETILGNGSIALELDEQLSALPAKHISILVPVSGGGLLAGIALAIKTLPNPSKTYRIVGVQQLVNGSLKKSLAAGKPVKVAPFSSAADALVALMPGKQAFNLIKKFVDDVVLVSEPDILSASRLLMSEQKLLVEPAGAIGIAALRSGAYRLKIDEIAVCLLTGGNVTLEQLLDKKRGEDRVSSPF